MTRRRCSPSLTNGQSLKSNDTLPTCGLTCAPCGTTCYRATGVKSVRVLSPCFRSFDDAIVVLSDGHPSRVRRCAMGWDIRREGRAWSGNALDRYELAPGKIELIITCGCAAPPSESRALSEIT